MKYNKYLGNFFNESLHAKSILFCFICLFSGRALGGRILGTCKFRQLYPCASKPGWTVNQGQTQWITLAFRLGICIHLGKKTYPLIVNNHFPRLQSIRNFLFEWVIVGVTDPTNFVSIFVVKLFKICGYPALKLRKDRQYKYLTQLFK